MPNLVFQRFLSLVLPLIILVNGSCASSNTTSIPLTGKNCEDLLMDYAFTTSNFTQCFILHARPITVCQQCHGYYLQVIEGHNNITKLKDEDTGQACKLVLINVDRLEVIEGSFQYVTQQWKLASCSKCFDPNGGVNLNTEKILELRKEMDDCVRKYENETTVGNATSSVCTHCVDEYQRLNDFYDSHRSYNGFCMDIIDMMNTTRFDWSVTLQCCSERRKPEPLYLVFYCSLLCMSVMFYALIWCNSTSILQEITYHDRRRRGGSSEQST